MPTCGSVKKSPDVSPPHCVCGAWLWPPERLFPTWPGGPTFHSNSVWSQNRDLSFASKSGLAAAGSGGDRAPIRPRKQEWEWFSQLGSLACASRGTF